MKKAFIGLLATMLFIAFGPNCFSQNGLITSEDYYLTARLNGADCFIGNALVEVYSDVVMAKYYKSGEKVLSGHTETYNFDKVDNNGNRVYLSNVESSTYKKLTYYSNGTILISTYSITYIPYVGRKDISIADYRFTKGYVKASSNGASNNNSYNNSYNNSQSAPRQCNLCGGSGRCCGAGNVAYANQYCNGTGRCNPCGGSGLLTNSFTGQKMNCTYCNGTGRCSQCSGSGRCGHCGGSGQQR